MQKQVGDSLSAKLANPGDVYKPARIRAIGNVNTSTNNLQERLKAGYSGRGFGRSGKVLTNARAVETSRTGQIGGLDAQFAGMQSDYETNLLKQAQGFAFASPGNTQTGSGDVAGGATSSGLSTLTTLLTLSKLLKGGGSAGDGQEVAGPGWGGGYDPNFPTQ
jgi:hypothetical protein